MTKTISQLLTRCIKLAVVTKLTVIRPIIKPSDVAIKLTDRLIVRRSRLVYVVD